MRSPNTNKGWAMAEGQNIVICCDGTDNTFGNAETNVRRLYDRLGSNQQVYYDPGLGTDPSDAFGSTFGRAFSRLAGRTLAFGVTRNVLEAYEFLMEHYDKDLAPEDHSGVFLFGFSRGAFTVRRLAKLVAVCGLPPKGGKNLIPYAYQAYNRFKTDNHDPAYTSFKNLAVDCKPHFVGVWDTVRSIGLKFDFIKCDFVSNIDYGRHALALHERRQFFKPEIWTTDTDRIEQRWFAGDHSDVGGGHDEVNGVLLDCRDDLSYLSLQWMVEEAVAKGLRVEETFAEKLKQAADLVRGGFVSRTELNDKTKKWYWRMWLRSPRDKYVEKTHTKDPSVDEIQSHIAKAGNAVT